MIINIFNNLGIKQFTYLDLGAHHPYNISNTALLYKYGCRGINVEANPNLIEAFFKERPLDRNINIGIGTESGEMPFYMIDGFSGRNSFDKEVVENFCKKSPGFSIKEIKTIKVLTLYELINKYANGKFPDFLSIDIEGLDAKVLSQIIPDNAPMVIDVEVLKMAGQNDENMIDLLKNKGFLTYFKCGPNLIFVRKDIYEKLRNFN
ncbi:MAG: FkbM family methyltransferase [Succinivibrio sp.]